MFLPRVTLTSNVYSKKTLFQLSESSAKRSQTPYEYGSPYQDIALNLGEYAIYNFGKDKDTYEIAKLAVERAKEVLVEGRRSLRFDVTTKVYNLKTKQDLYDIAKRSVESAQIIYELIESRIPLKKASATDLSSAEVDLLTAKNVLAAATTEYDQALWDLNQTLDDPVNHRYFVREKIKYEKFKTPLEKLLSLFRERTPAIRDAKLTLAQAEIYQRLARKNALPLPTVSLSGISVGYSSGTEQTTKTRDTTLAGTSGNFNVSTTLNFTMPLTGEGGLFGRDTLRAAEIYTEQSELTLRTTMISSEISLRTLYAQILQQESTIENTEVIYQQASAVFERAVHALQNQKVTNRLELKNAIEQLRTAEQGLTSALLSQFSLRLQIAKLVAVDTFEGIESL